MGRWRWMLREFLRARSPSPAPRGLAEPARRRHRRPSPSPSPSPSRRRSRWLGMHCPARVPALTATIPTRDPTARKRARDMMGCKVLDTAVSSLQDFQDSKPLDVPKHKAILLERQQEASWEEASLFVQRMNYLLSYPGELLKDAEEDDVDSQDGTTVVGTKNHLEWDSSPESLQTEVL